MAETLKTKWIDAKVALLRTLPLDKAVRISKKNVSPKYVSSVICERRKKGECKDIRVSLRDDAAYLWRDNN